MITLLRNKANEGLLCSCDNSTWCYILKMVQIHGWEPKVKTPAELIHLELMGMDDFGSLTVCGDYVFTDPILNYWTTGTEVSYAEALHMALAIEELIPELQRAQCRGLNLELDILTEFIDFCKKGAFEIV